MNFTEKAKQKKINIAIDGWSACGKGTLAKDLSQALGYLCIDTGAMYRAVTWAAIQEQVAPQESESLHNLLQRIHITLQTDSDQNILVFVNGKNITEAIRSAEVNAQVSQYSALTAVRRFLVKQQQDIAKEGGVVMDGRDIGTVVLPHAELKIFMTASHEIRAQRRYLEEKNKGKNPRLDDISANIQERDHIDANREDSPLQQAKDAKVLDNSHLNTEEQRNLALRWAIEAIENKVS